MILSKIAFVVDMGLPTICRETRNILEVILYENKFYH